MKLKELVTIDNICQAYYECAKASFWKESTQKFGQNLLLEALKLQKDLLNEEYTAQPTIDFKIHERGKTRYINAPTIRDRVVQKLLMTHILMPALQPPLIYDNYASLKNRGTSLARKRMSVHLQQYIRKHGTNGYILQIDIKNYFNNIDHAILKKLYREQVHQSPAIMNLLDYIIDTSSNSDKGLNLGSECPQIFATYYLHPVDTFIKIVCGEHYYGRYMDDIYIISDSKEHLQFLLAEIQKELSKLKLEINEKKTHITKLTHGFTFLQIKYNFNGNHIVKRLTHDKIVRERRRLKKFRKLVDDNKMTEAQVYDFYKSWRQAALKDCNACWNSIQRMDALFYKLFPKCRTKNKSNRPKVVKKIFDSRAIF